MCLVSTIRSDKCQSYVTTDDAVSTTLIIDYFANRLSVAALCESPKYSRHQSTGLQSRWLAVSQYYWLSKRGIRFIMR